jgi:hypothetical protein
VIVEAVGNQDLWIWHAFFGVAGTHNDINVLMRPHVFAKLAEGQASAVNFEINDNSYNKGYYPADGIYPQWSIFVKTIHAPNSKMQSHFAKCQEACRKDVERAFGVLQQQFSIVRYLSNLVKVSNMGVHELLCDHAQHDYRE